MINDLGGDDQQRTDSGLAKTQPTKPVKRKDRPALSLEGGATAPGIGGVEASIRGLLANLDGQLSEVEADQARDILEAVLPEFVRIRTGQSPARIAGLVDAQAGEVVASVLPQFRAISEGIGSELSALAIQLIAEAAAA
jgi:hypothetical protein